MHQKISEFPTLDSYSPRTVKRTTDTKFVDSCLDMIRMYSLTVYVLNSRMGCWITVNHFTTLLLLSVWDLIARYNIPMPTKGSCLKLITSGSSKCKVKRMTSITPSKNEFHFSLYYTSPGLHQIRSSNFRRACQPGKYYQPFLGGATRLITGYYVLKLTNTLWWFQQSTRIFMVGLIVLTGSPRLSNKQIRCILYPLEQYLDWRIWWGRMLHRVASIAYGL